MRGPNREPLTEERRQELRDQLAKGRATRDANAAARRAASEARRQQAQPLMPADEPWMIDAMQEIGGADAAPSPYEEYGEKDNPDASTGSFTESPEFKAAVEKQVEEILGRVAARTGQPIASSDTLSFARNLAEQLAEVADQGNPYRIVRVSPDEAVARREARKRMEELIVDAYARSEDAEYELLHPVYIDEVLFDAVWTDQHHVLRKTRIALADVPNEAMRPLNPLAQRIHAEFIRSIGGETATINRPDLTPSRKRMRVIEGGQATETPSVGTGEGAGRARIIGREGQPDEVILTRVLGTVAPAARQLA